MIYNRCYICEEDLVWSEKDLELICFVCKRKFHGNITCKAGHYLCDKCASRKSIDGLYKHLFEYNDKETGVLACKVINKVGIYGNSPHPITSGVLLRILQNNGMIVSDKDIVEAMNRARKIPGGWCGSHGNCGAAVGLGVAISVFLKANPNSGDSRSLSNAVTARGLLAISKHNYRCCVHAVYDALKVGIEFCNEEFSANVNECKFASCPFSNLNKSCHKFNCHYYNINGEV